MRSKTPITDLLTKWLASGGQNCPVDMRRSCPVDRIREIELQAHETAKSSVSSLAVINKRREWDKLRKRKARALSTGQAPASTIESLLVDSDSINSKNLSSAKNKKLSGGRIKQAKPIAAFLPADWQPSTGHYAEAQAAGVPREVVDEAHRAMRNWTLAEAHRAVTKKSDWNATFTSTWLSRAIADWKRQNGVRRSARKTFGDVMHGRG